MRSEGRICWRKPVQLFPDVRGQVEDIILGNREAQNLDHPHSPKQEHFNIRHQQLTSTDASDRTYPPSVSQRIMWLNVPRTSSTRPKP
ncbi:hypothetical protein TNIN_390841 [Trichonephila inaurata madagascariensis]|uniref:Uncharacterized protein n=1 Tax=Trichonephila inaurata madagascariensis TaxID=2747483 RepID=A0A8X6I7C9_9ARAC|nr:hypothetical protein TNIN_390841 [Trichonephila inaurata madagascariensis]